MVTGAGVEEQQQILAAARRGSFGTTTVVGIYTVFLEPLLVNSFLLGCCVGRSNNCSVCSVSIGALDGVRDPAPQEEGLSDNTRLSESISTPATEWVSVL